MVARSASDQILTGRAPVILKMLHVRVAGVLPNSQCSVDLFVEPRDSVVPQLERRDLITLHFTQCTDHVRARRWARLRRFRSLTPQAVRNTGRSTATMVWAARSR